MCSSLARNRLNIPPPGEGSHYAYRISYALLTSSLFEAAIAGVIILNAIVIGVDQTYRLRGVESTIFDYVETVFLFIYSAELVMRFIVQGFRCLKDNWVKFDTFIIFVGYVSLVVLSTLKLEGLEVMMVLRTVRMLRLCRTVGLLVKFRVLWMMAGGLLDSAGTMLHTLILLLTIIYVFASIGIELTAHHPLTAGESADEDFAELVQVYFRNLPVAMLTLLQFVCLDSVAAIYKPLIEKDMSSGTGLLILYFVLVVLIMPIVLMNIVTAVIVNRALEQATQDREAQMIFEEQEKKRTVKNLKRIFLRLDQDNSGGISFDEIQQIDESDWAELQNLTSISNVEEIFKALDVDCNDRLDIDEFCQGIWHACISKVPVEIQRMQKQVTCIHQELKRSNTAIKVLIQSAISDAVGQIRQELRQVREQLLSQTAEESAAKDSDRESTLADSSDKEMPAWGRLILTELESIRRGQTSDYDGSRQPLACASGKFLEEVPAADPGGLLEVEELVSEIAGPQSPRVRNERAAARTSSWSATSPLHPEHHGLALAEAKASSNQGSLRLGHSIRDSGSDGCQKASTKVELGVSRRTSEVHSPRRRSSFRRSGQEPECPPSFRPQLMMVSPQDEAS